MNKKILVLSVIILIAILAIAVIVVKQNRAQSPEITKQELQQKFQVLKTKYDQAKASGVDVSEIEKLGRQAKQAFDNKDYKKANEFLEKVALVLRNIDKSPSPISTPIPAPDASENSCASAPAEYRAQCEQKVAWLDQKLIEWKPVEYKPMDFDVYHVYASDNIFVKTNSDIDNKMLDAILEVDPDAVLLYIRPKEYFSQKARYDELINKIRNSGKKLFIGARFDDIKMSFSDYDKALNDYTKNIIALIKPDYYGIVIEPVTMESKHSFSASDEDWKELVKRISELSKQLSSSTKTVAAGHKEELNFLRIVSDVKDVDIIGFNIYGTEGIYSEYSGYLGKGDVVGSAIDYANSKGKETWIPETWTSALVTSQQRAISIKEFMKPIDAKWIRLMVYYAQKHNMSAIAPFYTGKFVYYGSDQNEFVSALNNKQRTPAFEEYKSVIEEIRNKKQSETKDGANSIVNINKDESMPDSNKKLKLRK